MPEISKKLLRALKKKSISHKPFNVTPNTFQNLRIIDKWEKSQKGVAARLAVFEKFRCS